MEFFNVVSLSRARELLAGFWPPGTETVRVGLLESYGCLLAQGVAAPEDLPPFARATVDGYAVRAADTFGASEALPALLRVTGEVVIGSAPGGTVAPGTAWRIPTGGMLPPGADAVVMVEHTEEIDHELLGVTRPVAPGENVMGRGEDVPAGSPVLPPGRRLRAEDAGVLAALGITEVDVSRRWRVAIVSTGDEIVAPGEKPGRGRVRDVNSCTLYGLVAATGAVPRLCGTVRDDRASLRAVLERACAGGDMVLVSGGSSVGTRDVVLGVAREMGRLLFHGLAVRPGKPTAAVAVDRSLLVVLPGHPVSALVVYLLLVEPLLLYGGYPWAERVAEFPVRAAITRSTRSAPGREDFVRVRVYGAGGRLLADPVLGKSGAIGTMVRSNGLAWIPPEKEGVEAGEEVPVRLLGPVTSDGEFCQPIGPENRTTFRRQNSPSKEG